MPQNKQEENPLYRHRPYYKTPVFWVVIVVLIAAIAVATVFQLTKTPAEPSSDTPSSTINSKTDKEQTTDKTDNEPQKTDEATNTSSDSSVSPDGKTPTQYEGNNPNLEDVLTGFLSTSRFDNEKLIIRVAIDQYLSNGTCTLVLSDGNNSLEKTAKIIPDASTSTCEGFDVATSELSNFSRPINIEITTVSGTKTGTIKGSVE